MMLRTSIPRRAFTLLELLICISIIGGLIAILIPSLEKANERARITVCAQNLHQLAISLNAYASEFSNAMPLGPASPSSLNPARPWNTIGSHQLWIASAARYNGMGFLVSGAYLSDPHVFICPSDDDKSLKATLGPALGGPSDVYCSYAYRQLDQRSGDRLTLPGINATGNPARALIFDWQSAGPAPYAHNSHDGGEYLNIVYADSHIQYFHNDYAPFGATAADYTAMPASYLKRLDQIWINADWAEGNPIATAPQLP